MNGARLACFGNRAVQTLPTTRCRKPATRAAIIETTVEEPMAEPDSRRPSVHTESVQPTTPAARRGAGLAAVWIVGALGLAGAIPASTSADDANRSSAILIVAREHLPDSNFRDAVVLVMNNLAPAPVGLIVNRPTRLTVSHVLPDVERLTQDGKLYFGGPVGLAAVVFLFGADDSPEHATKVLDGLFVSTDQDLLRKLLARPKPMERLRIFVGHAGWAPGQLEAEIARGDWTLAPAEAGAIFDQSPEHPWPEPRTPDDVHST
jgi:putative transcriptional regulator